MTVADLRTVTQDHTTIWLTDAESNDTIQVNELRFVDEKYDRYEIEFMFPERYPDLHSIGLTVFVKKRKRGE